MTMFCKRAFLTMAGVATVLCVSAAPAVAANAQRYGVMVYSNLCVEAESGDTGGNRITLSRFTEGDHLVYEYSEGALEGPVLAESVKIDAQHRQISFTVRPPNQPAETIEGVFSADGKVLTLRGDWCGNPHATKKLSLVADFSRPLKECPPCPPRPAAR